MPRLTNAEYLKQRMFLVKAWNDFQGIFTILPYVQQMEVHEFYATTQDLTNQEAIAHRHQITQEQPSLPNRVGKLFPQLLNETDVMAKRLAYAAEHPPVPYTKETKPKWQPRGTVKAYALARAEPDLHKFTRALLGVARDIQAECNRDGGEGRGG